jgi:hypothetical protein
LKEKSKEARSAGNPACAGTACGRTRLALVAFEIVEIGIGTRSQALESHIIRVERIGTLLDASIVIACSICLNERRYCHRTAW